MLRGVIDGPVDYSDDFVKTVQLTLRKELSKNEVKIPWIDFSLIIEMSTFELRIENKDELLFLRMKEI